MTDEPTLADLLDGDEIEPLATTLTPKLALPYPSSSDPVASGATNIRDLALALDGNTKLVGPTTAVLNYAAGMRRPAFDGEIVIVYFDPANTGANLVAYSLARGVGITWYLLSPAELAVGTLANFHIAAGAGVITLERINLPVPVGCTARYSYSATAPVDSYIVDGNGAAGWSARGIDAATRTIERTAWSAVAMAETRLNTPGAVDIANRSLVVVVNSISP
jgi:hypothetical protein